MNEHRGFSIVKIGNVLLAAVEGEISDREAEELQNSILNKIGRYQVHGILVDLSAVDLVDSFLARSFSETARMAAALSATVIICGLQPAVAITIVELGLELENVLTALNVDMGMEMLERLPAYGQKDLAHG